MPDNYANLLLTDIPYNGVNRKSNGLRNLDKNDADILNIELSVLIPELIRVTSELVISSAPRFSIRPMSAGRGMGRISGSRCAESRPSGGVAARAGPAQHLGNRCARGVLEVFRASPLARRKARLVRTQGKQLVQAPRGIE